MTTTIPATPETTPLGGSALGAPLFDAQGRRMTYLRLSVTDRCNFRCAYCSPASWGGKKDQLSATELIRIASVFARMGISRVRLTGGEPLIRPDVLEIAAGISALEGIRRVAITTNASRLAALARPLVSAGVQQLNLSLDTLNPATFRSISKQGEFESILEGIDAAASAGFESLKLNVVVMKGVNDHEAPELIRFAHARGITPRFIELMPFGKGESVPTRTLIDQIRAAGIALDVAQVPLKVDAGPARYLRAATGEVGFISPMTENFCSGCNRVRVSATGELRSCLGGRAQAPLAHLIRGGSTDEALAIAIRAALGEKQDGHRFNEPDASGALLPMMGIGG
ncbi:MAG: GTP 3',8-cyclase MoaA [Myxococcaceae bacterium]